MTTATALYTSNPITPTGAEKMVADGAGGTTGGLLSQSIANLFKGTKGADIASATTTDIGAATGVWVHVTGTTTITSLGTAAAGQMRWVVFDGALLLTHNATSLILPTGANITTAAGDAALAVSEGAGNWRVLAFWRKSGASVGGVASVNGATGAVVNSDLQGTGTGANDIGFRTVPQNSQSAAYTLVAADSGKHIYHPSTDANARTFTIPANASVAFPIGTAVTFINETAQVVSIAITTDTLALAGTGATGTRSLAQYGIATAIKVTATRWLISGTGLT